MNIKLTLNNTEAPIALMDGTTVSFLLTKEFNMLLDPLYATEDDILSLFMEDQTIYWTQVQKIIFESSIKADQVVNDRVIRTLALSPKDVFMIKRDYTICLATYKFGIIFYRDYVTQIQKQKFLADVKVSLNVKKDPTILERLLDDAESCFKDIEDLLNTNGLINTFVKGELNPCNRRSDREWYPSKGGNTPRVSIAANKTSELCRKYKIGVA